MDILSKKALSLEEYFIYFEKKIEKREGTLLSWGLHSMNF